MPALGARVLAGFLLGACLLGWFFYSRSCHGHQVGFPTEGSASVAIDLTPVLANVPGHVRVLACVEQTCVRRDGSSIRYRGGAFRVNAAFTDPETIDVRVVLRDYRGVIFDATRLLQFDESQPDGPRCDPTLFNAGVQATPEGDLVLLIPASV
jgi:hypothetical protein